MNKEHFYITKTELPRFKSACEDIDSIKFIKYDGTRAHIEFDNSFNLFYLGQLYGLKNK